jgi:thiol-disulfide isomerase/thioredoxin
MPHTRVSALRPIATFVVLAGLAFAIQGCGSRSRDLEPGSYRAVLESPGGELPFGLDVAREESGLVLYLVNGKERVRVPEVVVEAGKLTARMPGYENAVTATISGDDLEGEVTLVRSGGRKQSMPLKARRGQTWRFYEEPFSDNADFAGRWSVTFTDDKGRTSTGVAAFEQLFGTVTGTILTPSGDYRFLAGDARGDELQLSRFDGAQAHLFRAKLNERGELEGQHWSGNFGHERFVALRNPDAELDMSPVATGMKDPAAKLQFTFPDLDGKPVSLADPRFQGKVVIVTLAGSWCPNCHDEASFLAQLYREHRAEGLEIVSLMFEHSADFTQAASAARRFRKATGIDYATLIAGRSDGDDAVKALPQLTGVFAFPTTIWVDRAGVVRKIHAGFSGPATGAHYTELKDEFTDFTLGLLAAPGTSEAPTASEPSATSAAPVPSTASVPSAAR